MQHIKSETQNVNASSAQVYNFISDFNNLGSLMPDRVTDWKSTMTSCSFVIQGMATLNMKQGNNKTNELVNMVADGKNPFQYDLNTNISGNGDESCEISIQLNADMNPMLSMMAKKPLQNFVNILAEELKKHFD